MDRKDFFKTLIAPKLAKPVAAGLKNIKSTAEEPAAIAPNSGINPYTGTWSELEVIHLLKRLQFGAPKEEVAYFKTLSYTQAVDELLNTVNNNPGAPIKTYITDTTVAPSDADWGVPTGKTWIGAPSTNGNVNFYRQASVKNWWMDLMINQPRSIEEKMVLFWSTHFSIEFDTAYYGIMLHDHMKTLRQYAMGNFRDFVKAISLQPSMLVYLNGRYNTLSAPDENYGRELQELFTMGKGPGSHYTEDDVKAAAKVLTGYYVNTLTSQTSFVAANHDTSNKQFSSFYNNTVITGRTGDNGRQELDELVNMIFSKDEVSRYICRRLYRFFVSGTITANVEANVIEPLAAIFRANNYVIKPVLSALFKSEHFFDVLVQGSMIKSPLDFIIGQMREFKVRFPGVANVVAYHKMLTYLKDTAAGMDQDPGDPPTVAGWSAYFQDPLYDKLWVNTDTYIKRLTYNNAILNGYTSANQTIRIDWITFAKRMSNPADPNSLLQDFNTYLLRMPLSADTLNRIKTTTLLTGQTTDGYWTDAWNIYVLNPANATAFSNVNSRLQSLVRYFISMEEYHLM